jgi:phage FluMu protein Com
MDATRCAHCNKRMKAVMAENGRTEFKCLKCDLLDPLQTDAVKWAESPLAASVAD